MSRFPCSLCGSTNWPSADTSCNLCYADPDLPEDEEGWNEDKFEEWFSKGWKCAMRGGSLAECPIEDAVKERDAWLEGFAEGLLDTQSEEESTSHNTKPITQ